LPEPPAIVEESSLVLSRVRALVSGPLAGKKVLISAGPTREAIDPVRYISNHSSGTMGYEIARAAARRGADVVLVSGPTSLAEPENVRRVDVISTADMHTAVMQHADADVVVMVAAVADFTIADPAEGKVKKDRQALSLSLQPTVDILADLGRNKRSDQTLVGFALETDDGLANAKGKLKRKNLDWIVLNNPTEEGAGFGPGTNKVTLVSRAGEEVSLPVLPKADVAEAILEYTVLGYLPS